MNYTITRKRFNSLQVFYKPSGKKGNKGSSMCFNSLQVFYKQGGELMLKAKSESFNSLQVFYKQNYFGKYAVEARKFQFHKGLI